ncbi:UDP-glucose dehydrogenase family protein [Sanguibacter gelidistatuariae]|uniref:UDP-glucose dehydrogenase family protein n=1 Tax=Sanguibacter gelidistatuariae TaxID=1814289 RepID=UPI000B83C61B|nr:UDP-glucose/GDP-mannose dehydrogenase family protein [Sanguibacter gelidistatuariae]
MRIAVIGCGYLGAVHAACMADLGHDVVGVDLDPGRIAALAAGRAPFHEPGFPELLGRALSSGRLTFTTDLEEAARVRVFFLCVGTPQLPGSNAADLSFVDDAVRSVAALVAASGRTAVVVGKSTVPVGTAARLAPLVEAVGATLIWNPEFLREGYAVRDTLTPNRIVYGLPDGEDGAAAQEILDDVYADQLRRQIPRLTTDYATAELVKVAANSFLATKISFINAMAEICELTGADVTQLAGAIGMDDRIGKKFLQAGIGFGGGCLPKDIRAFTARAEELGAHESVGFLREVDKINLRRRDRVVDLAKQVLGERLVGARVAVLGAAFKPHSDDLRDSPAVDIATRLQGLGADVVVTDPAALPLLARLHPALSQAEQAEDALRDADLVVLATEWREYVVMDPYDAAELVRTPVVIDGRNVLNPARWRRAGWTYLGLGRP